MLYDGDVEFADVIELFSDGNYDGTSNTHVTLNKYLNALKIFGMKVKKLTSKEIQNKIYNCPCPLLGQRKIQVLKS